MPDGVDRVAQLYLLGKRSLDKACQVYNI